MITLVKILISQLLLIAGRADNLLSTTIAEMMFLFVVVSIGSLVLKKIGILVLSFKQRTSKKGELEYQEQ